LAIISISTYFFPKSKKENEKWTFLKMSKIENPKKVLKKGLQKMGCDHNALVSN
jgi:predicted RNA-binding protein with PUA-like domain